MDIFPTYEELDKYIYAPKGLQNTNSKCYFNAIMQLLMSCPSINKYMKQAAKRYDIAREYTDLLAGIKLAIDIIYTKCARSNVQEDPHETLMLILNKIEQEDKKLHTKIYNCLFHRAKLRRICANCKAVHNSVEENVVFHFDISYTSLDDYTKEEIVEYKCEFCEHKTSTRSINISRLGPIFLISINKYTEKKKTNIPMTFALKSNIEGCIHNYKLIGQIQHNGSTNGGHHYAICRRQGGIFMLNDEGISSAQFIIDENTYMLAYAYTGSVFINKDDVSEQPTVATAHT